MYSRTRVGILKIPPISPRSRKVVLESLLAFQTMVSDLTGLPIANASLLDEGTAAAEAMTMFFNSKNKDHDHVTTHKFFVDQHVFAQTKDILATRAQPIGIQLVTGDFQKTTLDSSYFGAIIQYPDGNGAVHDYRAFIQGAHAAGAYVVMATDLLALTLLSPPGELGADVAVGNSQRFGVPMGFGASHAAFFTTRQMKPTLRSPVVSSGSASTPRATEPSGWRCRPANNISNAKKQLPISVQRRRCWRIWQPCMPSTTDPKA